MVAIFAVVAKNYGALTRWPPKPRYATPLDMTVAEFSRTPAQLEAPCPNKSAASAQVQLVSHNADIIMYTALDVKTSLMYWVDLVVLK